VSARKNILIADDNPVIRFIVRSMVESAGFEVCAEAETGTQAILKADELRPDLILLDLYMPDLSGAEAASVLKKHNPNTPIVLFTIHTDSINDSVAKRIGVDKVIAKPDGITTLVESVRELLAE
jgi:DNA-binding NarL/FixJ family response regulator